VWWLLLSCWLRGGERNDPVEQALVEVDRAYAQRVDVAELQRSIELSRELLADAPDDPRVLAAIARGYSAMSWGHPSEESLDQLSMAREYGLRCLALNTGFRSRQQLAQGRVSELAVRQLGVEDLPCLEQVLVAWVRWSRLRGPAGALDLDTLAALGDRASDLGPDGWIGPWSQAMAIVLEPGPIDRDLDRSEQLFLEAIRAEPGLAEPMLDRARYQVILAAGRPAELEAALREVASVFPEDSGGDWALENRAARAQVASWMGDTEALWRQRW
jgi:hypothetical protein